MPFVKPPSVKFGLLTDGSGYTDAKMPADLPGGQAASPDEMSYAAQLKYGENSEALPATRRKSLERFDSNQNLRAAGIGSFRASSMTSQTMKSIKSDDAGDKYEEIASIVNDPYDMYAEVPAPQQSQTQFDEDRKASEGAWRRVCYFCACFSCVIIIGLSIGLGTANSNKQVDAAPIVMTLTPEPSESPTGVPTASPKDFEWCYETNETNGMNETIATTPDHDYERYDSIESSLISLGVSTGKEFSDNTSYQKKALCWLAYGDRLKVDARDPFVAQRYALATIYYSFGEPSRLFEDGWLSRKSECEWDTVICDKTGTTVMELGLQDLETSTLPKEMSVLKYIYSIDLSGNSLNEDISEVVGSWTMLETLKLSLNRFQEFPSRLSDWKSLRHFEFRGNDIEGPIPDSLALSTQLVYLDLANNDFSGTVPSELGNMISLESLFLHDTELEGTMPEAVCELRKGSLNWLSADCEPFSGGIDCEFSTCCTQCSDTAEYGNIGGL